MSAEDLINRVKQRRLNQPTSDAPPTFPPYPTYPPNPNAPTTTTPPATPTFTFPKYVPTGNVPQASDSGGDRSFLSNVLSLPGGAWNSIFDVANAVPGLIKAGYQTGVGITSGFSPKEIQKIAVRVNEAQDQGLKGFDIAKYSVEQKFPLATQFAGDLQTLGGNVGEVATLGKLDVGEPGVNYAQAFNRGQLSQAAIRDLGTVITAGRLSGLGNVGITAGAKVSAAGAPRLGSAITSASRFVDEPIGSSVRGAARVANLGLNITPGLSGLTDATGRISTADQPLRQIANESIGAKRAFFEERLKRFIGEEEALTAQMKALDQDDPVRETLVQNGCKQSTVGATLALFPNLFVAWISKRKQLV
jgi:hypothetical protein